MSQTFERYTKRRLRSSYFSVVVSISLVLYVLGAFGVLIFNAQNIADQVRENFSFSIMLKADANMLEVKQFQKQLELNPAVKQTEFVSKDEAAADLEEELDEEFVEFLGYNPLMNSIDIRLHSEAVESAQIEALEKEFLQQNFVHEVVYDRPLIQLMNDNIRDISLILMAGFALLTLIAIGLINSSIRLSIYAKRFTIKTMQLVGATKGFIRKPFLAKSIHHGLLGSLLASLLLYVSLYYVDKQVPGLATTQDIRILAIVVGGLMLMGILISTTCTFFAMKKYLKLKTDQLYF